MKALVKNELRLTRKILLIWMGIVLILCGFAYFEYLSLKDSLNELTGLISDFPKILKAMFGVSGDLTSADQQLCGLSRCFVYSERTGAGNGRISIYKTSEP